MQVLLQLRARIGREVKQEAVQRVLHQRPGEHAGEGHAQGAEQRERVHAAPEAIERHRRPHRHHVPGPHPREVALDPRHPEHARAPRLRGLGDGVRRKEEHGPLREGPRRGSRSNRAQRPPRQSGDAKLGRQALTLGALKRLAPGLRARRPRRLGHRRVSSLPLALQGRTAQIGPAAANNSRRTSARWSNVRRLRHWHFGPRVHPNLPTSSGSAAADVAPSPVLKLARSWAKSLPRGSGDARARRSALALAEAIIPGPRPSPPPTRPPSQRRRTPSATSPAAVARVAHAPSARSTPPPWPTRASPSTRSARASRRSSSSAGRPTRCSSRRSTLLGLIYKFVHFDRDDVYAAMGGKLNVVTQARAAALAGADPPRRGRGPRATSSATWSSSARARAAPSSAGSSPSAATRWSSSKRASTTGATPSTAASSRAPALLPRRGLGRERADAHLHGAAGRRLHGHQRRHLLPHAAAGCSSAGARRSGTDVLSHGVAWRRTSSGWSGCSRCEPSPREIIGPIADFMARGCDALGWHHALVPRNAPGCDGKGFCDFGCRTDARLGTNLSYIPAALEKGAMAADRRARGARAAR